MKRTAGWERDALEEVAEFLEKDIAVLTWKRDTEFKNAIVVKVPGKRTPVLVFKSQRDAREAAVQNVELDLVQDPLGILEDIGWLQQFISVKNPKAVAAEEVEDHFDFEMNIDEVDVETLAYEAGMEPELDKIFKEESRIGVALDEQREMWGFVSQDDDPEAPRELEHIEDEIERLEQKEAEVELDILDFRERAVEAWKKRLTDEWAEELVLEPIYWAEARRGSNLVDLPEWMVFDSRAAAEDNVDEDGVHVGLSDDEAVLDSGIVVYDF
jgi:hypothetical protein